MICNMVIQRMRSNCGLGMLKSDEKVVKLDPRTLENLDYQTGIVREKNRKNINADMRKARVR